MLANEIRSNTSPDFVYSLETFCEFIDNLPILNYSGITDDESEDNTNQRTYTDLTPIDGWPDYQDISHLRSISENSTDSEKMFPQNIFGSDDSQSSSEGTGSPFLDDENEKPFNSKEWFIKDASTGKLRPPKLYEFLSLLLNNPRYVSYASWLNKAEGLFKIHKPSEAASLWKQVKIRRTSGSMDYDTFARGIRYYYKSGSMLKTHTKHTYCFAQL